MHQRVMDIILTISHFSLPKKPLDMFTVFAYNVARLKNKFE